MSKFYVSTPVGDEKFDHHLPCDTVTAADAVQHFADSFGSAQPPSIVYVTDTATGHLYRFKIRRASGWEVVAD